MLSGAASQTPLGELTLLPQSPDSLAGFKGAYFLWQREEERKCPKGGEGKWESGHSLGREGK